MQRLIWVTALCFVVGVAFSSSLRAEGPGQLRLMVPVSFLFSKNEVLSHRLDLGTGLHVDFYMLQWRRFWFGPGVSLFATLPAASGNAKVSIRPYSALTEFRVSGVRDFFAGAKGFSANIGIGTQLGSLIVTKNIGRERRVDADFLFGGAAQIGLVYWLNSVGFGANYGLAISNIFIRHRLEFSLQLALIP